MNGPITWWVNFNDPNPIRGQKLSQSQVNAQALNPPIQHGCGWEYLEDVRMDISCHLMKQAADTPTVRIAH